MNFLNRDCTEKNVTTLKEWDFLLNIHLESVQKRVDTCFSDKKKYFNENSPGNPFLSEFLFTFLDTVMNHFLLRIRN